MSSYIVIHQGASPSFGRAQYFLQHSFGHNQHFLAAVDWFGNPQLDTNSRLWFVPSSEAPKRSLIEIANLFWPLATVFYCIVLYLFICHTITIITSRKKKQEERRRRPKGNYRAYVNQASSITIFRRWHKNYSDGYKIISGRKLNSSILQKFTNNVDDDN